MVMHMIITVSALVFLIGGGTNPAKAAAENKDMVFIPQGEFTMGSNEHADETKHQVVLDPYWIDKFETSNARYREFMKATSHAAPAYWDDPRLSKANQPVVGVSWTDANAFCKWEGKRLPTEAEWERAAKGPDGDRHYPWGHSIDSSKANYGQNVGRTAPIDSYPEGVSGYGVYNMAGNVFEWVDDWYDPTYYKGSIALNPKGADQGYNFANQGPVKVLRGAPGSLQRPLSTQVTDSGISPTITLMAWAWDFAAQNPLKQCRMKPSNTHAMPLSKLWSQWGRKRMPMH